MTRTSAFFAGSTIFAVAVGAALFSLARADRPAGFLLVAAVAVAATVELARLGQRVGDRPASTQASEKFRRIFETMADGYYRSRLSDGGFIDVNPAAAQILGYPSVEVLMQKRTIDLYANPDDRAVILAEIQKHGEFRGLEVALRRYDGGTTTALINGRFLYDGEGKPIEVEANFFDMSAQKEAEAALEEARLHAEQANVAKSAFLANMSHELRTPMNAIIGYGEMLMEDAQDEGNEDAAADLRKIHGAATHLLGLINDILDLSKVEAGKMEVHRETFEIPPLIEEVASTLTPAMEKNGNRLVVEIDPALTRMNADLTKVRQALLNLLSNAAKFSYEGEVALSAQQATVDGVPHVRIAVRDSGIGIPPDKLDHVFEEFSQADETTTRTYGGTGLGLPISRRFCRMMDGDITVKSQVGAGSVFTVVLPIGLEESVPTPAPAPTPETGAAPATGRTVLVIDDDPNALDLLGRSLQGAGLRVVTASDGEEALRIARSLRPSAITLDVQMPGMDGWAVLRELKADPETREIPVVMITMTDDRERGYALGATDFLTKPVDRTHLVELLARCAVATPTRHALIVDDQDESRAVLRHALESAGWQVSEAENGRVALECVAHAPPSLILLDLMMPVMDGFEFVVELRKQEAWCKIPIVVVTAKDVTEEERSRLNGSVAALVEKSGADREALLAQIRDEVAAAIESGATS